MANNEYIEYIINQHCLPPAAINQVSALLAQKLPHGEYLSALSLIVDEWYCTEPDHLRYDRNRARFPYPYAADLAAAAKLKRKKREARRATPLISTVSVLVAA